MIYSNTMNKSGVFKEEEPLVWENKPAFQGWTKTQEFFATIWIDCEAFKLRLEGGRLYESTIVMTATCSPAPADKCLTHS